VSYQVVDAILASNLPPTEKLVLAVMGRHADTDTGLCYPSQHLVARESGYHRSTVIRTIRNLEQDDVLIQTHQGGKNQNRHTTYGYASAYKINLSALQKGSAALPIEKGGVAAPIPEKGSSVHAKGSSVHKKSSVVLQESVSESVIESVIEPSLDENSRVDTLPSDFALTEKPSTKTDPRHSFVRNLIELHHREKFQIACTWDASEGKQLFATLKANPGWTLDDLEKMIRGRFDSAGVTPDRPRLWLPNLGKYAAGPLDQYGKLQSTLGVNHGTHTKPFESFQQARNRRNREVAAKVFGVADHNGSNVSEGPDARGTDEVG
jgi:hypothetical protein